MKHARLGLILTTSAALFGCSGGGAGGSDETASGSNTPQQPSTPIQPVNMETAQVCGSTLARDWQLVTDSSELNFVTIKKSHVTESHTFDSLSGALSVMGTAHLTIDLGSLDTGIELRDERMESMLFEIATFPQATASIQFSETQLENLSVGASQTSDLTYTIDLHGFENDLSISTQVTCLSDNEVLVKSAKPFVIDAAAFGLEGGVEALREIAGLDSISPFALVDFTLVYEKEGL